MDSVKSVRGKNLLIGEIMVKKSVDIQKASELARENMKEHLRELGRISNTPLRELEIAFSNMQRADNFIPNKERQK